MWLNRPRSAGAWAAVLLCPQVALGALLAIIPDTRAPLLTQLLTLVHVVTATASLAGLAFWVARHGAARTRPRERPQATAGALTHAARWAGAIVAVAACATGALALWGGQGTRVGEAHAIAGLALALPLAAHLLRDAPGAYRGVGLALLAAAPLALPASRAWVARAQAPASRPAFATRTRPAALWDSAAWCGGCHVETYAEWRTSTHARALGLRSVRVQYRAEERQGRARIVDDDVAHAGASGEHRCVQCHAPTTYYGDARTPVLADAALAREGIPCAFCHTLRAAGPHGLYVAAPDAVSRYVGQGSSNAFLREVGDLLIRWRPAVHRRDYKTPWMEEAAFCAGCHIESFEGWRDSPWALGTTPGIPRTTCQDCHMARDARPGPTREPGRLVPWGAVRPQRRAHVWCGGNARAGVQYEDARSEAQDRALRASMISLRVTQAARADGVVTAEVTIRNERVGHHYPSGEGGDARDQWIELQTLDAAGAVLDRTTVPQVRARGFDQARSPFGTGVALIHQRDVAGAPALADTRVPPRQERAYQLRLFDRPGVARVRAVIRSTFDPRNVAEAEAALPPG